MERTHDFTRGPILGPLTRFALPIFAALLLQAMYGAVDLLVVGRFGTAAGVSAVATGSSLMQSVTGMIAGLSMGLTVLLGQLIGAGDRERAGDAVGAGIAVFGILGAALTAAMALLARPLCRLLDAPPRRWRTRCAMCASARSGCCSSSPTMCSAASFAVSATRARRCTR